MNLRISTYNARAYVTKNWKSKYYRYNSYGFRDEEIQIDSSKKIF